MKTDSSISIHAKRRFLLFVSSIFFFLFITACKKSSSNGPSSNSDYYVNATIGGNKVSYKTNVFAHKNNNNSIQISGQNSTDVNNVQYLSMAIIDPSNPIQAKDYLLNSVTMDVILNTTVKSVQTNYSASTGAYNGNEAFDIKITSIDGKTVKGTFSGWVYILAGGPTIISQIEIDNGTFYAPIH